MKRIMRIFSVRSTMIVLILLASYMILVYAIKIELNRISRSHNQFKNHFSSIVSALIEFGNMGVVVESDGSLDAGVILNSRIKWRGNHGSGLDSSFKNWQNIPPEIVALVGEYKNNWIALNDNQDILKVNTDWMKSLPQYNFWNIDQNSPIETFAKGNNFTFFNMPEISYVDILASAKIRCLQALGKQEVNLALLEIKALARLLYSTGYQMPALSSIVIMQTYERCQRYATNKKPYLKTDEIELTGEKLKRIKSAIMAFPAMFEIMFHKSSSSNSSLEIPNHLKPIVCPGLREFLMFKSPTIPFYYKDSENYFKKIELFIEPYKQSCRLNFVVRTLAEGQGFWGKLRPLINAASYLPYSNLLADYFDAYLFKNIMREIPAATFE